MDRPTQEALKPDEVTPSQSTEQEEVRETEIDTDQQRISPEHEMKMKNEAIDKIPQTETIDYGMSLLQDKIYYDSEIQINPALIDSLTEGFVQKFIPSLERNRKTIAQIKDSQSVLIETVQQENAKFKDCQAMAGLEKTMSKAKLYHAKLLKLRRDMSSLHDKSAKLKRRALRLQQQKQKEELTHAQQLEYQYEREKMITARVAAPSSPTAAPSAP